MNKRRISLVFLLLAFAGTVLNFHAGMSAALPANEPWTLEKIGLSESDYFEGRYVTIAHHPVSGAAYISFISYWDGEGGYYSLYLAREVAPGTGNCDGNKDWECIYFGHNQSGLQYTSIDVDWVVPAAPEAPYTKIGISYYDADQKSLKYAQYVEPESGNPFWTFSEVDDSLTLGNIRGIYSSLKFNSDHQPIIAYHYVSTYVWGNEGGVKIASFNSEGRGTGCGDSENDGDWDCETIDSLVYYEDYGSHVSLDLTSDGTAHMAFYDSYNSELVWAYLVGLGSGTCGNDEWNCVTVDGAGDVGQFVSIHAPKNSSDKLRFAYFDNTLTNGKVKYAVKVPSGGNCGDSNLFKCFDVDDIGDPLGNIGISITVDNQGYPIIAYMDASSSTSATKLMVARPALAYGNTYGNCGEVPPGDVFLYWQCELLDPGYQDIVNEAAFVDVSISPSGLATIVYYEDAWYDYWGKVKVAQQHYVTSLPLIIK